MAEYDDKRFGPPPSEESFRRDEPSDNTRTQSQITESTDSCCPDLHNTVRVFSETMVYNEVSMSISENRIEKWRVIKSDKQTENRIGYDGPGDVPYHYAIQYVGGGKASNHYLSLNDCGASMFSLVMGNYLPRPTDDMYAKYMFSWIPKKPRAGFLKVMTVYAVLDLNTDTKGSLKIIPNEPPLDDTSLVCRDSLGNEYFILFFNCNNKRYVLKPDDKGELVVEEEGTDSVWRLEER